MPDIIDQLVGFFGLMGHIDSEPIRAQGITVKYTLMLNSQQRWSSIVNHNGVCPSGHGQGIV